MLLLSSQLIIDKPLQKLRALRVFVLNPTRAIPLLSLSVDFRVIPWPITRAIPLLSFSVDFRVIPWPMTRAIPKKTFAPFEPSC